MWREGVGGGKKGSYPLEMYGSWVWIGGMYSVWVQGMDRGLTFRAVTSHQSLSSDSK